MYRIVGVEKGVFEGHNWAVAHVLQSVYLDKGVGWKPLLRGTERKPLKIDFNLACEISKDWSLYENQDVDFVCDPTGRIIGVDIAG